MKLDWKKIRGQGITFLKRYRYVLLVIAVGIGLLKWPAETKGDTASQKTVGSSESQSETVLDLDGMERKLEEALSQIDRVGEATVVLTLQSGSRQVYATEEEISQTAEGDFESSTQVARISTGSGTEAPVEVMEIYPVFQGALVVCDGGDDSAVRLAVTHSISALTGLSSDHISVCGRSRTGG